MLKPSLEDVAKDSAVYSESLRTSLEPLCPQKCTAVLNIIHSQSDEKVLRRLNALSAQSDLFLDEVGRLLDQSHQGEAPALLTSLWTGILCPLNKLF